MARRTRITHLRQADLTILRAVENEPTTYTEIVNRCIEGGIAADNTTVDYSLRKLLDMKGIMKADEGYTKGEKFDEAMRETVTRVRDAVSRLNNIVAVGLVDSIIPATNASLKLMAPLRPGILQVWPVGSRYSYTVRGPGSPQPLSCV